MLMGSVSGTKTVQVHLAHSYSETCEDNTDEMSGLSSFVDLRAISAYSVFLE